MNFLVKYLKRIKSVQRNIHYFHKEYSFRPQFEELKKFMDYIVDPKDTQALIKLFYWDEIDGTAKLGDYLKETSIDYGDLNNIKDAIITKEGDDTCHSCMLTYAK